MKLYYHKTDGGAEYLTDRYIETPEGSKEGVLEGSKYIVRLDGDVTQQATLTVYDSSDNRCGYVCQAAESLNGQG